MSIEPAIDQDTEKLYNAIMWAKETVKGRKRGNGDIAHLKAFIMALDIKEDKDEEPSAD